ncbi:MAG: topoisomerase C-terminal repeat-containing protein, partial [Bacteroidales bacterium]
YKPFHKQVEITAKNSEKVSGERLLGTDPLSGVNIYVKLSRFGPVVQKGETKSEQKPVFAGLKKGQSMDAITIQDALDLFKLPRVVGVFEEEEMVAAIGRFGPYIRHKGLFVSIPKTEDPLEITENTAIELIQNKRKADQEKIIKSFNEDPELLVLNGRFGPYISFEKKNYKIEKSRNAGDLTLEECREIIAKGASQGKSTSFRGRKAAPSEKKKSSASKTRKKSVKK